MPLTRKSPVLAGVLALVLAGCATPSSQGEAIPEEYVEAPTISAEAKAEYGDSAEQAYQEVAEFVLEQSLRDPLLDPQKTTFTAEELSTGITEHLTPGAAFEWDRYVQQALAGDRDAKEAAHVLRVFGFDAPSLTAQPDGSVVESQAVSGAKVGLAQATTATATTPERLSISFEHRARITLMDGKSPYPGTVLRELTFTVLPSDLVPVSATVTPTATTTATPDVAASPTVVQPPRDPSAAWLIEQFDGVSDFDFDRAPSTATPTADPGSQSATEPATEPESTATPDAVTSG